MADVLTAEQFEDTRDSLQTWLCGMSDVGMPGPNSEDGVPYTTVAVSFVADELEKAVDKFKSEVLSLQGTNGFYVRVLPELTFDGEKSYNLRARVAPKSSPEQ
jgi:hypothetical protein